MGRARNHRTRLIRTLLAVLALCALAQIPGEAAARSCSDSSDVQAGAPGSDAPRCSVIGACPASRTSACKLTGTVTVEGTGIVSAQVRVGKGTPQGCSSINSCTFSLKAPLPAGKKTPVSCEWLDGYAVQIKLTCSAAVG